MRSFSWPFVHDHFLFLFYLACDQPGTVSFLHRTARLHRLQSVVSTIALGPFGSDRSKTIAGPPVNDNLLPRSGDAFSQKKMSRNVYATDVEGGHGGRVADSAPGQVNNDTVLPTYRNGGNQRAPSEEDAKAGDKEVVDLSSVDPPNNEDEADQHIIARKLAPYKHLKRPFIHLAIVLFGLGRSRCATLFGSLGSYTSVANVGVPFCRILDSDSHSEPSLLDSSHSHR